MVIVSQVRCPSCGAPLPIKPGQRHVICVFCNTSSLIHATYTASPPQLTPDNISRQDIEQLKQLVLDGKRDEAIDFYVYKAGVPRPEAETAVNDMLLSEYWRLTRELPLNAFGFILYFTLIGFGFGLALIGAVLVMNGTLPFLVLVPLGGAFALWQFLRFVPKVISTWVSAYGAQGRARVMNVATLRTFPDCVMVQVAFEVTPSNGSHRFVDEEILMLRSESIDKLRPNNVIMVRFDEPKRRRVFPISPIQVVA
jgi:LSD1 subclass zinc finger protein